MLTEAQIAAGRESHRTLQLLERAMDEHHAALARLRDAFRSNMPDDQYQAMGGGTNKD